MSATCDLGVLVAAVGLFCQRIAAALQALHVGDHQLGLDRLGITDGIDAAFHMRDVRVLEAAQHVGDSIDLADVAKELVAEAFALRCAAHEAGDVDEGEARRDLGGRTGDVAQLVEARIGHADVADVGFDGAEGIVGRFRRSRLRQRVEEGGLADVRQAHDAAFEAHDLVSFIFRCLCGPAATS